MEVHNDHPGKVLWGSIELQFLAGDQVTPALLIVSDQLGKPDLGHTTGTATQVAVTVNDFRIFHHCDQVLVELFHDIWRCFSRHKSPSIPLY